MKRMLFICLILITSNSYSQQTEKYKKLIEDLIPIDSTIIIKKNRKGVLKVEGKNITYECNGNSFPFLKGEYLEYYNNGKLRQKGVYDEVGTLTFAQKFNRQGQLKSELIATKIDTKTTDLCELLDDYDNLTIHLTQNYYEYSKSSNSHYISKTIYYIDGKKIKTEKFTEPNNQGS